VSRQEQHAPGELGNLPADAGPPSPDGDRPDGRPRQRLLAVAAALAVVAAAVSTGAWAVLADRSRSGTEAAVQPPATAPVERTTLVDRERYDGTLGYDDPRTLTAGAGGTLTALRDEGATVERGQTLLRVDHRAVTVLYGAIPLYRTLEQGIADGTDVKQLEENLDALGTAPA
jgi:hypothetical protein